jgi:hypothetical protein
MIQSILEWFLTGSIYGIFLFAAVAGAAARLLSKVIKKRINHFAVGGIVFLRF